jgi:hypothetical protein
MDMKRTVLLVVILLLVLAGTMAVMRVLADPVAIISFTATPRVVMRGESVTLDWQTRGVPTVAIEWGPELNPGFNMQKKRGLPPSGMETFEPQEDTIYVLECETVPADACSQSVSVRVR